MKIKITVEKVVTSDNKVMTFSPAQDQHLDGANLRFFNGPGDKLVVLQFLRDGTYVQYYTDFAFAGATSATSRLDAAPTTGQWVLT
jgi:hypothetical protein